MSTTERVQRGQAAIQNWAEQHFGWGPSEFVVHHIPHLSTPRYDLFWGEQKALRDGGEIYLMSDGENVFPSNRKNLGKILIDEGLLDDPDALPAKLVGELFIKMAEVVRASILEDADDPILNVLTPDQRSTFRPPTVEKQGGGIAAYFWSVGPDRDAIIGWEVHLAPDGTLTHQEMPL